MLEITKSPQRQPTQHQKTPILLEWGGLDNQLKLRIRS